jgi:hypothetical protein
MEWKKQTHLASGTREKIPFGIASHMLPGQPPAWHRSLGQGPLGHVSHAWPDALLRPTAKPESNLLRSELSHFSQLCFREVPAFSRNFVTCPQSSHLYSNIGTARSPFVDQSVSTGHGTSQSGLNCSVPKLPDIL